MQSLECGTVESMVLSLPTILADALADSGLPARPDASLDPYLDAAEACVRRYGWSRTSPRDIAREAGVERSTVYRHLGSKDTIFRLLVAREVHRLIDRSVVVAASAPAGPEVVVEVLASAVEHVRQSPSLAKLLEDDPELVSRFLDRGVPDVIARFRSTLSPLLAMWMDAGFLARRDPVAITEWGVRIGLSVLFAPPPGELRRFLAEVLVPVLEVRAGADGGRGAS